MTGPQQFDRHSRKMVDRWGEPAVLKTYAFDGTYDDYRDPEFTETTQSVTAYFDETFGSRDRRTSDQGAETTVEIEVWLKDTDTDITQPTDDSEPSLAPRIVRTNTGLELVLNHVSTENNGLIYAVGTVTD